MVASLVRRWQVDAASNLQHHAFKPGHDLRERRSLVRVRVPALVNQRHVVSVHALLEGRSDTIVDGLVVEFDRRHPDKLVLQAIGDHLPHDDRKIIGCSDTIMRTELINAGEVDTLYLQLSALNVYPRSSSSKTSGATLQIASGTVRMNEPPIKRTQHVPSCGTTLGKRVAIVLEHFADAKVSDFDAPVVIN